MKKIDVKTISSKNTPSKMEKKAVAKAPSKAASKVEKKTVAKVASKVEKKTMKNAPSKMEKKTMKNAPVKAAPAPAAPVIPAEIAALLATYGIEVPAAPQKAAPQKAVAKAAPQKAAPEKAPKAERTYTTDLSSKDFSKELFATPLTEEGCEYYNERVDIIKAVCKKLSKNPDFEDILEDIKGIEDVEGLVDFLVSWGVGRRASRVIMHLVSPVVCVCCEDTERLASECFGITRANSLMGSCHNTYMCAKWEKEDALPFERTCCNFSTICSDIEKSAELCSYYFYNLNK